jgi:peptidoglycan/LPS O-acetylase OafA/YrhL
MSFYLANHPAFTFVLVACICYLLAFGTGYVVIRCLLPATFRSESRRANRYIAIDGIRGYLAFGVYVHHCLATWMFLPHGNWSPLPHNFENQLGATSVALFFMITAFLFWGRAEANPSLNWKAFFVTRFFRIYPLYLFVFLCICLIVASDSHWIALESPATLAKELGKWFFFRDPDINLYYRTTLVVKGVTWTLLYEAWFYVCLPLFVFAFLKRKPVWTKVAIFGVIASLFKLNHIEFSIAATFLGGVCAVYWRKNQKRIELAQTKTAGVIAVASLLGVVVLLYRPFNFVGILFLTVFFIVISSGNTLFGVLKTRTALWLGEISYSIYLCHGLVLWLLMQKVVPRMQGYDHSLKWFAATSIGITPIVILLCSLSYLLIEKPLIVIGHEIASRGVSLFVPNPERRPADAVQVG